jgi:uncharacterized OB-fold protein
VSKIPASPRPNHETARFWEAANDGALLIKKCNACGKTHYYPRAACPLCYSEDTEWLQTSGRAAIYSFSVLRRAPVPYVLAYVTLEEGPTIMTNIVDTDFDAIAIGQIVELTFKASADGQMIPMFKVSW